MIQRVSELDLYTKEEFMNDYLDMTEKLSTGEDNPNYGNFKSQSFCDNLSSTMLFEISLGRPMDENGALDDSLQNEKISYYKSYKVGGDVIGQMANTFIANYFNEASTVITINNANFGTPGRGVGCSSYVPDGSDWKVEVHERYPDTTTSAYFYSYEEHHNNVVFHGGIRVHDKARFDLGFSVGSIYDSSGTVRNDARVDLPGLRNVPPSQAGLEGPGSATWYFNNPIHGVAMSAYWADLAECYSSDAEYPPGTLVKFGGEEEITIADNEANAVVTTKPGLILNSPEEKSDKIRLGIALTGRTPVRVVGPVKKFDRLCLFLGMPGVACKKVDGYPTIAIALEDNDSPDEKLVLCTVQLRL